MSTQNGNTPRTSSTRTIVTAQHTVTIQPDGSATCTCPSFRNSAALFGEGYCSHLRQSDPITRPTDDDPGNALDLLPPDVDDLPADVAELMAIVRQLDMPDVCFLAHFLRDLASGRLVADGAGSVTVDESA